LQSFQSVMLDGKKAFDVTVTAGARNLLHIVYEQREREEDEEERSREVQQQAVEMGLA